MISRWMPVLWLGLGLFAVNVVARLVVRFGFSGDEAAADRTTLAMLVVVAAVSAVFSGWWCRAEPVGRWALRLGLGSLCGLLLSVLVGPAVSGVSPFAFGAGEFFKQVWQWAGATGVGVAFGYGTLTALGRDMRSRRLAELARPARR